MAEIDIAHKEEELATPPWQIIDHDPAIDSLDELDSIIGPAYEKNKQFFGQAVSGIKFYFLYTRDQMDALVKHKNKGWVVGLTTGLDTIIMFSPSVFGKVFPHPKSNFPPVLTHEVAHVFTAMLFSSKFPTWLMEGVAGYPAEQFKNRKVETARTLNFSQIHDYEGWSQTSKDNYSPSFLFTQYLIEHYGKNKLFELLSSLEQKEPYPTFIEKFAQVYRTDLEACQKEWLELL
ncbi:hypothetical protein HY385_02635 [Candidatus Daviesbacteria bacterium]|nr:hypothetical protein [Candidatus Daviesbacteria bacterium]